MKDVRGLVLTIMMLLLVLLVSPAKAQVTNLSFNNSGTSFTMTSGDTVRWEYNLPVGSTATAEFWLDVNDNSTIDPGTDVLFFSFTQTDGDTNGNGGPPDLDGVANGHIIFFQRIGLPAGHYINKFTENGTGMQAVGTMNPLAVVAHQVSGTVTPPSGKSAKNLLLQLERKGIGENIFWAALTDSTGAYTIKMSADTAGPWRLSVQGDPFPGAVVAPQETLITIVGNPSGYDFVYQSPGAKVNGMLIDDNDNPITFMGVGISRTDGGAGHHTQTDGAGMFSLGILTGEMNGQTWQLQSDCNCNDGTTGGQVVSRISLPAINPGDSLYRVLRTYASNSTIQGQVQINGSPAHIQLIVAATNADTGESSVWIDTTTGNFSIPVSNKIANYNVAAINLPFGYSNGPFTVAHPGDVGVIVALTTDGVVDPGHARPKSYGLSQNFPNPFNPSTMIQYDLPERSRVVLKVFTVYGQEVGTLVNGVQEPGRMTVHWNAGSLASGIYFYRIQASALSSPRRFTETRKLVLVK